ncbi:hypothetical protein Aperf_G00000093982 [Anoplocephala perfoliata]
MEGMFRHDDHGESSKDGKHPKPKHPKAEKGADERSGISDVPKGDDERNLNEAEKIEENVTEKPESESDINADMAQVDEGVKERKMLENVRKETEEGLPKETEQNVEKILAATLAPEPEPKTRDVEEIKAEEKRLLNPESVEPIAEDVTSEEIKAGKLEDDVGDKELEGAEETSQVLDKPAVNASASCATVLALELQSSETNIPAVKIYDPETIEPADYSVEVKSTAIVVEEKEIEGKEVGEKENIVVELKKGVSVTKSSELEQTDPVGTENTSAEIEKAGEIEKDVNEEPETEEHDHNVKTEVLTASIEEPDSQSIEENILKIIESSAELESSEENIETEKNGEDSEIKNIELTERKENEDKKVVEESDKPENDQKEETAVISASSSELQVELQVEDEEHLEEHVLEKEASERSEEANLAEPVKLLEKENVRSDQTGVQEQELEKEMGLDESEAVQSKETWKKEEGYSEKITLEASEQKFDSSDGEKTEGAVEIEEVKGTLTTDETESHEIDKSCAEECVEAIECEPTSCQSSRAEVEGPNHHSGVEEPKESTTNEAEVEQSKNVEDYTPGEVPAESATETNKGDVSEVEMERINAEETPSEKGVSEETNAGDNEIASKQEGNQEVKEPIDDSDQQKTEKEATPELGKSPDLETLRGFEKAAAEEISKAEEVVPEMKEGEEPEPIKIEKELDEIQHEAEKSKEEGEYSALDQPEAKQVEGEDEAKEEKKTTSISMETKDIADEGSITMESMEASKKNTEDLE